MSRLNFTAKQKQFWNEPPHRWNIKCGATRSGKTFLDYYLIPKRIRAVSGKDGLYVILGNTKGTLQRNIIEPLQKIWGDKLVSDISSDNTARMFGEKVHCIGADKISQANRLRGSSIKYCYGDEVVTWNEEVFNMLKSRMDKPYSVFDGTCNPEHPEHWFKKFIDNPELDIFLQNYSIYDNTFIERKVISELEREYAGTVYFDRFILGKWVRAEGIIFRKFADNPGEFMINAVDVPHELAYVEVGFDIGGNGSAYALTASGIGNDGCVYVLKSQKIQPDKLNMEDVTSAVQRFSESIEALYGVHIFVINSDHVDVVINSINDKTKYRALKAYKPPLEDRVFLYSRLLAVGRLKFAKNQCDDLIYEMKNLVFDKKSGRTIPLDDGSMQIDAYDSLTYSLSGNWSYLDSR